MNVLEQLAHRAQAVKVLAEAGVIRPMRPEKAVHMACAAGIGRRLLYSIKNLT